MRNEVCTNWTTQQGTLVNVTPFVANVLQGLHSTPQQQFRNQGTQSFLTRRLCAIGSCSERIRASGPGFTDNASRRPLTLPAPTPEEDHQTDNDGTRMCQAVSILLDTVPIRKLHRNSVTLVLSKTGCQRWVTLSFQAISVDLHTQCTVQRKK